jgi:excisionase family DNA binding protein
MELPAEILSFSEAARELGVNRMTVADLVRCRGIKVMQIGPSKAITRADLESMRKALRQPRPASVGAATH